jgi:hypothetical protein
MHPDVHRYLDGELPRSALSQAAADELAEWERLSEPVLACRSAAAPESLVDDVMRALPAEHSPAGVQLLQHEKAVPAPGLRGAWDWLVTPRPLTVRPFAPLAAAAALLLVIVTQLTSPPTSPGTPFAGGWEIDEHGPVIYVQFALNAEGARSVVVAGDFNDWSTDAGSLRDVNGDGVFRGLVAVRPGVHKYMFVVDGEEWVTDPDAERYVDDGFGMRNALLAIAAPGEAL